jgi:hypothetical protein
MAATDIQYGGLDPVLFTPDYSFLKYVLDKKTANYEKGLQSASSSYNNLKKELTDPKNVQKRDQYLKDVQGQLQTIASSDFSLQQNVNYANSIFEPIATDKAILFDAYHTARIKNELAKEDAWMKSEDLNVRKRYNAEIAEWTARDLESIKKGNGDINNYKGVQNRSAVAYIDPQDILDDEVKAKGFKYEFPTKDGAYIITEKGGVGGTKNYEQFANEVLSNNEPYKRQNAILGQNRTEKIIEHYKTDPKLAPLWANKKNDEILSDYAIYSFDKHKIQEKEGLEEKTKNLEKDNADILAALNGPDSQKYIQGATDVKNGVLESDDAKLYLALKQKSDSYNGLKLRLKEFQEDYDKSYNDVSKEKYLKSFVGDAGGFLSNQQFLQDITRFSNIKASSYVKEIKENKAVIDILTAKNNALSTINKIEDTKLDNTRADLKLALEEKKEDFNELLKGNTVIRNADGTKTIKPGKENETKFVDASATQVTTSRALNNMKNNLLNAQASALNNVTSNYGMFSLLNPMGVSKTDTGLLRQMFSRYFTSTTDKPFVPKPEENKALSRAYTSLWAFSKDVNSKNTFLEKERANFKTGKLTIDQLPDWLDRAMTGYTSTTQADMDAKRAMGKYKTDIELIKMHSSVLEKGKQVIAEELKNNSDFQDIFKYKYDSKSKEYKKTNELVDGDYIYETLKKFKDNTYEIKSGFFGSQQPGVKTILSDDDLKKISESYLNGSIDVSLDGTFSDAKFTYNGKNYMIEPNRNFIKDNNVVLFPFPYSSQDYQKKLEKINERIPIGKFEQNVGTLNGSPFFTLSGQTKKDVVEDLAKITPTNSNIIEYSDGTFNGTQVDPEEQKAARNALYKDENIANISLFTSSPLNSGGQAISVTYNKIKGDSNNPEPYWSGKTLYFPISPTKSSPKVFQIFNNINEGITEFETSRQKGEPYPINTFKAEGVYAEITPSQPGSTTGTVQLYFKPYDIITKKFADQFVLFNQNGKDKEFDLGITTYKEIEDGIFNTFIYPYVNGTLEYNTQQKANTVASGNTPITANSIYQSLIK